MGDILEIILPIFLLMALGAFLSRFKLAGSDFFRTSDRLVYFIFFPVMLFWKVAKVEPDQGSASPGAEVLSMLPFVLLAIFLTWLASLLYARLTKMPPNQIGGFSQVTYRFNTYVGMAVVLGALGEEGMASFALMISLAIPFINVLAVSTLVWFSPSSFTPRAKIGMVLKGMLKNPLILACLAGIVYNRFGPSLPGFVESSFRLVSSITLPLALLSIGSGLGLEKLKGRMWPALASCALKLLFLPLVGYTLLSLAGVSGDLLTMAMVFFMLPTATAAYILAVQLNGDADLTAASIVMSTLLSFVTLSLGLALLI